MKSKEENKKKKKVGYKRPPEETQFKPGESGNPAGRPPGSKNLKTILRAVLAEEIDASTNAVLRRLQQIFPDRFNGKKVRLQEAINLRLVMMALGDDPKTAFSAIKEIYDRAEGRPATVIEKIDSNGEQLERQTFKLPGGLELSF
jgi:hypothetical protein